MMGNSCCCSKPRSVLLQIKIAFKNETNKRTGREALLYEKCEGKRSREAAETWITDIIMDRDPQRGDLIEISRPFYQHWAVYVGSGYVVHLTSADGVVRDSLASANTNRALVKIDRLLDACGGDQWKVNNKYDNSRPPKNVEEIVRTALSCVGQEVSYNVLLRNCEHFATFLRYDQPESGQAFTFGVSTLFIAASAFLLSLLRS